MQTTRDVLILADPGVTGYDGIRTLLRQEGYNAVALDSLHQFMQFLSESAPLAVIVADDYRVSGGGWIVAEQVKELHPALPVLLLAHTDIGTEQPPVEGTCRVLTWPVAGDELQEALGPVGEKRNALGKCA